MSLKQCLMHAMESHPRTSAAIGGILLYVGGLALLAVAAASAAAAFVVANMAMPVIGGSIASGLVAVAVFTEGRSILSNIRGTIDKGTNCPFCTNAGLAVGAFGLVATAMFGHILPAHVAVPSSLSAPVHTAPSSLSAP